MSRRNWPQQSRQLLQENESYTFCLPYFQETAYAPAHGRIIAAGVMRNGHRVCTGSASDILIVFP